MSALPQTFAIEIVDDVLPDLIEVVRNPHHPNADALLNRARETVQASWNQDYDQQAADRCADVQFDTLLAVAETGFRLGWWS